LCDGWLPRKPIYPLTLGPLLQSPLLQVEKESHVLVTMPHRLRWLVDGDIHPRVPLSMKLPLHKRLALAELPIQYGDFAVWQRQWLTGGAGKAAWKQQLAAPPC